MAQTVQDVRPGPKDMLARMSPDVYREAYSKGRSLAAHLEMTMQPSDGKDGLTQFERLIQETGIITRSLPGLGFYADKLDAFEQKGDHVRMLVPELLAQMWRQAAYGTRAIYTSADEIPGTSLRPYAVSPDVRVQPRRQAPFALADLVAVTTPIEGNIYKAFYLQDNVSETRMVRVAETADIPTAKLVGGEKAITIYKYGRGLESSYETLRRMRIDKVQFFISRLAIQTEIDKIAAAMQVIVSGDGNANTSATNWRAKTDLDAAATGYSLTLKAYLLFKMKFQPSYQLTHLLGTEGDIFKVWNVPVNSSAQPLGTLNVANVGGLNQMGANYAGDVALGITPDVPSNKLVGIDASASLEQVTEIGANITEIERYARKQTEVMYMTESMGFAVLDPNANKTLELES